MRGSPEGHEIGLYSLFQDGTTLTTASLSFAVVQQNRSTAFGLIRGFASCQGFPWTPFDLTLLRLPPSALDPETWRSLGDLLASRPGDCAPDGTLTNDPGFSYEGALRDGEDNQFLCRGFLSIVQGQDPPEGSMRP